MKPDTQSSPTGPNEVSGHKYATIADRTPPAPDANLSKSQDFSARGVRTSASPFVPRASGQHQNATSIAVTPVQSSLPDQAHISVILGRKSGRQEHDFDQRAAIHRFRTAAVPFNPTATLNDKTADVRLPSEDDFTSGPADPSSESPKRPFPHHQSASVHANAVPRSINSQGTRSSSISPASIRVKSNKIGHSKMSTRFITEQLYEELRRRRYLENSQMDESRVHSGSLPRVLNQYHSLVPLDDFSLKNSAHAFGLHSILLRGISSVDGMPYALRRLHHRYVVPSAELTLAARVAVDRWSRLVDHPHIAALHGTFVSADMWDTPALFFAHEYHAGAVSLESVHCGESDDCLAASEAEIWMYASQLCCALKAVHDIGLAVGGSASLAPNKLLLCSKGAFVDGPGGAHGCRIRLAAVGVIDVLRPEAVGLHGGRARTIAQRDDLRAVGISMANILCGSVNLSSADALAIASRRCSPMLNRVIMGLVSGGIADSSTFSQMLVPIIFDSLKFERALCDQLKSELAKELENGRLLRLLIKLTFINERPDGDMDPNWAETGDRYILKLFRDFVFHQHDNDGNSITDWGHVFECLNKLDTGVAEKVLLVSRDEMSMLVASYADIKRCTEVAYAELIIESKRVDRF